MCDRWTKFYDINKWHYNTFIVSNTLSYDVYKLTRMRWKWLSLWLKYILAFLYIQQKNTKMLKYLYLRSSRSRYLYIYKDLLSSISHNILNSTQKKLKIYEHLILSCIIIMKIWSFEIFERSCILLLRFHNKKIAIL